MVIQKLEGFETLDKTDQIGKYPVNPTIIVSDMDGGDNCPTLSILIINL